MFGKWLRRSGKRKVRLPRRLADALRELSARMDNVSINYALIGGVACSAHGHVRATLDIDFLIAAGDRDRAHALMQSLGFEVIQSNRAFANYVLKDMRVDFLVSQVNTRKTC
jgi:hypothetical protein